MRTLAILALAALISLHAAELPFKLPAGFSCAISYVGKGKDAAKGSISQGAGGMRRMDLTADGEKVAVIFRPDRKQMFIVMDAQKVAMVMPIDPGKQPVMDPSTDPSATWTKSGSESIAGVECTRYDWGNATNKGQAWVENKRSVLVRVTNAEDGSRIDFTDYQLGPQRPTLFEIPAGYKTLGGE
jgi:hypothetical protein